MYESRQSAFPSRTVLSFHLLIVATLLLVVSQFVGSSADARSQREGMGALWMTVVEGQLPLASASLLIGPEVRLTSPEGVFTGPSGVNDFSSTLRTSFTNLDFVTTSTEMVDNLVIITFAMTGIHTGPYLGLPALCAGVAVEGVAVLNVDESGIREQWIGYNQSSIAAQIKAFNQISPDSRPSCGAVLVPVPAPAPDNFR